MTQTRFSEQETQRISDEGYWWIRAGRGCHQRNRVPILHTGAAAALRTARPGKIL